MVARELQRAASLSEVLGYIAGSQRAANKQNSGRSVRLLSPMSSCQPRTRKPVSEHSISLGRLVVLSIVSTTQQCFSPIAATSVSAAVQLCGMFGRLYSCLSLSSCIPCSLAQHISAAYQPQSHQVALCRSGYAMEKKSSIIAIGLTIHNTPVDVREKLAIPEVSSDNSCCGCARSAHLLSSTHDCITEAGNDWS